MSFILFVPPLIQGARELVNISKTKLGSDSPEMQIDDLVLVS
jgi:hypothetical protein